MLLPKSWIGLKKEKNGTWVWQEPVYSPLKFKVVKKYAKVYVIDKKSTTLFEWSTLLIILSLPLVILSKAYNSYFFSPFPMLALIFFVVSLQMRFEAIKYIKKNCKVYKKIKVI